MSITNLLVDTYTQEYINTIYDYQVAGDGETIEWDLVEYAPPSGYGSYDSFVNKTIDRVDALIDLDFQYSKNFGTDLDIYIDGESGDGVLGLFSQYYSWGEIDVFITSSETTQSNKNTFVHELGHYLGLGEPGFDERYDQIDSVMSYNKSNQIEGGYRTWFASADIDILLEYFGPEDDGDVNVKEGDVNSNTVVGSMTTHDFLVGYGGNDYLQANRGRDSLFGGSGNDELRAGNGRDIINGGDGMDDLYGGFGLNTFEEALDGEVDSLFLKSDQHAYNWIYGKDGNSPNGEKADKIMELDPFDEIWVQGVETEELDFQNVVHYSNLGETLDGIGIYASGTLEAVYVGENLSLGQIEAMTQGIL